jgi:hypothetical protein
MMGIYLTRLLAMTEIASQGSNSARRSGGTLLKAMEREIKG